MSTYCIPECWRNVDTFVGFVVVLGRRDRGGRLRHRIDGLPSGLNGSLVFLVVVVRVLLWLGQCLCQLAQLESGVVLFLFLFVVQPLDLVLLGLLVLRGITGGRGGGLGDLTRWKIRMGLGQEGF